MLVLTKHLADLVLGDVHDPDLEILAGRAAVDEILKSAPRGFQLLEFRVVDDLIDLLGEFAIERRLDGVDGGKHVIAHDRSAGKFQRLLRQRLDRALDIALPRLIDRLELLL